jgi:hypothetical protein
MEDLFDEIIVCNGCGKKMTKVLVIKNGFKIRAFQCERCKKRIYHPGDIEEYKRFAQLKQRPFAVKLRMVGNSYTVSIPREIVDFMQTQEDRQNEQGSERRKSPEFSGEREGIGMHQRFIKMQNEMVKVFFEEFGKISLMFASQSEINKPAMHKEAGETRETEKDEEENNNQSMPIKKKIKLRGQN